MTTNLMEFTDEHGNAIPNAEEIFLSVDPEEQPRFRRALQKTRNGRVRRQVFENIESFGPKYLSAMLKHDLKLGVTKGITDAMLRNLKDFAIGTIKEETESMRPLNESCAENSRTQTKWAEQTLRDPSATPEQRKIAEEIFKHNQQQEAQKQKDSTSIKKWIIGSITVVVTLCITIMRPIFGKGSNIRK